MSERRSVVKEHLVGKPVYWQDWEDTDSSVRYWEQLTDLLMVGAVSAIADGLKDDPTLVPGLLTFSLFYIFMTRGWLFYTHHITCRFLDASLLHHLVLLFYLMGMAAQVVNATIDTVRAFSLAVILQRTAILLMLLRIGVCVERARPFCVVLGSITCTTMVLFGLAAASPNHAMPVLCLAALLDCSTEFILIYALPGNKLVPLNMAHSIDRLGALVMVMLGETLISSTITYRDFASHTEQDHVKKHVKKQYYTILGGSFLLIFMLALLYFKWQPPPQDHAFTRSRLRMTVLMLLNLTFGLGVLSVGVSIKLIVQAIVDQTKQPPYVLGVSVGFCMLLLLAMRICHYAGHLPAPHHPPRIRQLIWAWWVVVTIACLLPFGFMLVSIQPMVGLAAYSCLLLVLAIVGALLKDVIQEHSESLGKEEEKEDVSLLKTQGQKSYQSMDAGA